MAKAYSRTLITVLELLTSTMGLLALNLTYLLLGSFVFITIEAPNEKSLQNNLQESRNHLVEQLIELGREYEKTFQENASIKLAEYEGALAQFYRKRATLKAGFGNTTEDQKLWTPSGSVIFCFSVITTIGWGNIVPTTTNGRLGTIVYGLFGVPLLFTLSTEVGTFLNNQILRAWLYFHAFMKQGVKKRMKKGLRGTNKSPNRYATDSSQLLLTSDTSATSHHAHFPGTGHTHSRHPAEGQTMMTTSNNAAYYKSVQSSFDFLLQASAAPCDFDETRYSPHCRILIPQNALLLSEQFSRLSPAELVQCMKFVGLGVEDILDQNIIHSELTSEISVDTSDVRNVGWSTRDSGKCADHSNEIPSPLRVVSDEDLTYTIHKAGEERMKGSPDSESEQDTLSIACLEQDKQITSKAEEKTCDKRRRTITTLTRAKDSEAPESKVNLSPAEVANRLPDSTVIGSLEGNVDKTRNGTDVTCSDYLNGCSKIHMKRPISRVSHVSDRFSQEEALPRKTSTNEPFIYTRTAEIVGDYLPREQSDSATDVIQINRTEKTILTERLPSGRENGKSSSHVTIHSMKKKCEMQVTESEQMYNNPDHWQDKYHVTHSHRPYKGEWVALQNGVKSVLSGHGDLQTQRLASQSSLTPAPGLTSNKEKMATGSEGNLRQRQCSFYQHLSPNIDSRKSRDTSPLHEAPGKSNALCKESQTNKGVDCQTMKLARIFEEVLRLEQMDLQFKNTWPKIVGKTSDSENNENSESDHNFALKHKERKMSETTLQCPLPKRKCNRFCSQTHCPLRTRETPTSYNKGAIDHFVSVTDGLTLRYNHLQAINPSDCTSKTPLIIPCKPKEKMPWQGLHSMKQEQPSSSTKTALHEISTLQNQVPRSQTGLTMAAVQIHTKATHLDQESGSQRNVIRQKCHQPVINPPVLQAQDGKKVMNNQPEIRRSEDMSVHVREETVHPRRRLRGHEAFYEKTGNSKYMWNNFLEAPPYSAGLSHQSSPNIHVCPSAREQMKNTNANVATDKPAAAPASGQPTPPIQLTQNEMKALALWTTKKKPIIECSDSEEEEFEEEYEEKKNLPIVTIYVCVLCYVFIGSAVYTLMAVPPGLNIWDSLYFIYVMLSTTGFGDFLPPPSVYTELVVYGVIGMALFNIMISASLELFMTGLDYLNAVAADLQA